MGGYHGKTNGRFPQCKILEGASASIFLNDLKILDKIQAENTSSLDSSVLSAY